MAKKKTKQPELMQYVWIKLSDGRKIVFSCKAEIFPGDRALVMDVLFTPPTPIPPGYSFKQL